MLCLWRFGKTSSHSWLRFRLACAWREDQRSSLLLDAALVACSPHVLVCRASTESVSFYVPDLRQDSYDFHVLEVIQCMAERRAGGETGIQWVEAFQGADVWKLMRGVHTRHLLAFRLSCSVCVCVGIRQPMGLCAHEPVLVYGRLQLLGRWWLGPTSDGVCTDAVSHNPAAAARR